MQSIIKRINKEFDEKYLIYKDYDSMFCVEGRDKNENYMTMSGDTKLVKQFLNDAIREVLEEVKEQDRRMTIIDHRRIPTRKTLGSWSNEIIDELLKELDEHTK